MVNILVINAGSSTIKWQVVDPESGESSHSGLVEGLGTSPTGEDYRDALLTILDSLPQDLELSAVGHRVVHGGEEFGIVGNIRCARGNSFYTTGINCRTT